MRVPQPSIRRGGWKGTGRRIKGQIKKIKQNFELSSSQSNPGVPRKPARQTLVQGQVITWYFWKINFYFLSRPYSCEICDQKFYNFSILNQHLTSVHLNISQFTCPTCQQKFKTLQGLKGMINQKKARGSGLGSLGCEQFESRGGTHTCIR